LSDDIFHVMSVALAEADIGDVIRDWQQGVTFPYSLF
jgi:hypothetical protein